MLQDTITSSQMTEASNFYEKVNKGAFGQVDLVASVDIKIHTVVMMLKDERGILSRERSLRTIELADGWHIDHPDGGYVNHHCSPTCVINKTDGTIVAYRDIKKGEVINFNYMVNESEIDSAFHCKCGAHSCQGYIGTKNSQVSFLENEVSPTAPAAVDTTARTPKSKAGSGLTSDNSPSSVVVTATND